MKVFFIPLFMLMLGTSIGAGAGYYFPNKSNSPEEITSSKVNDSQSPQENKRSDDLLKTTTSLDSSYFPMGSQFVIPVMNNDRISSMVVMSVELEIAEGSSEDVALREPKIRDAMLKELFQHANIGGFDGYFTEKRNLEILTKYLLNAAQRIMGQELVFDVLIQEIARQDY